MKFFKDMVLTVVGMGSTTLGIILLIENQAVWPMFLVILGIPFLMASVGDEY